VNRAPQPIERVDTPAEALAVTLGEQGRVDLVRIADLLGLADDAAAVSALGDLIYADPEAGGRWVSARDYLAGDVRRKLSVATSAAADDDTYRRNVAALDRVVPADLGPMEIRASLGAPWIAPRVIEDFAQEVLGKRAQVSFTPGVALWEVEGKWWGGVGDRLMHGTTCKDPFQLLDAALNGRTVTVWDEAWDFETRRNVKTRNVAETVAAEAKVTAMQEKFSTWVWEDAERAKKIAAEFNRRFRSHVPRRSDGSALTFPGLADGVELWPWQKDIVDRIVASPRILCGHPVGSGKTLEMVAAAITLRRFGLATKPMIAVPGHLLEQIAREAQQAFPAGRFLVASKDDLARGSRRLFAARCATGDWDAVIITHESFTSIPVGPQAESDWIFEQKWELADAIRGDDTRSSRSRGAKAVATAMRRLEARLTELRYDVADPDAITFDQLGVDFLAVDELHLFKRLPIVTRAEGFSLGSSKRATDLLLKIRTLAARRGDRPHFAGFTGTPWSNTLAETYVWQTYLQPDRLRAAGIDTFDAWAAMFVRYETRVEVSPDGSGFRMNRRPSEVTNARVLMSMLGEVAELMPASALPLVRPDAAHRTLVAKPSEVQSAFVASLVDRAERIRSGGKGDDNMLVVCNDGRRVALDPALVGLDGPATKLELAADTISAVHHRLAGKVFPGSITPGALQLVLCDMGTPGVRGSQTYGRLKAALVTRGVPAGKVRFVHEATTDKSRAALFAACRDGSVAVLVGSTSKVGIGTNIQTRLTALHHVDAPWRPSDIEQREGRGLRPGNLNKVVDIYRYVTEGTFDAYMWQTLETKARFIQALLSTDLDSDTVADIGEQVLSFGEVKALAAGNPLLLEHAQTLAGVRRLRMLRSVHLQAVTASRKDGKRLSLDASRLRAEATAVGKAVEVYTADAKTVAETYRTVTDRDGHFARQVDAVVVTLARSRDRYSPSARWRGLELRTTDNGSRGEARFSVQVAYRDAGEVTVDRKALRRDPAGTVRNALESWVRSCPERAEQLLVRAGEAEAQAIAAECAADGAVFGHESELTAAEGKLAAIESEMERDAQEHLVAA
jgi:N12 class adenine-specific DNA methylase